MDRPEAAAFLYVDAYFLLNFLTDLGWLWVSGRLAGLKARFWQISLAAGAGAAAATWSVFHSGRWIATMPVVSLVTLALPVLAFWPLTINRVVRVALAFLLTGVSMAGTALLLAARNRLNGAIPSPLVTWGVLLFLAGGHMVWEAGRERAAMRGGLYRLRISLGDRSVAVMALLDTGNWLKDPLTGRPVAVVEAGAVASLLPPAVLEANGEGEWTFRWDRLEDLPGHSFRSVPYRAVGKSRGMLAAFVPSGLAVRGPGAHGWREVTGLVGLATAPLHPDGAYQALLSPRMISG